MSALDNLLYEQLYQKLELAPYEPHLIKPFAQARSPKGMDDYEEFMKAVREGSIPAIKPILQTIGIGEEVRKVAEVYRRLKFAGFKGKHMSQFYKAIYGLGKDKSMIAFLDQFSRPTSKISKAMAKASKVAKVFSIVMTSIEVSKHVMKGDYGPAAAELYKEAIGVAIPWAGLVDGIQELTEAVIGNAAANTKVFLVLKTANPIGLGGVGVDSMVTAVQGAIKMIRRGDTDVGILIPEMDRLVKRIRKSPAAAFAKIGDNAGDAVNEARDWKTSDWGYAGATVLKDLGIYQNTRLRRRKFGKK